MFEHREIEPRYTWKVGGVFGTTTLKGDPMNRLSLALCLMACGPAALPPGGGTGGGAAMTDDAMVNGKPASAYYGQLAWETTKGYVAGAGALPTQSDGTNIFLVSV